MPVGSRKAQAAVKRQASVDAFMRITHMEERGARALLSQSRWNLGISSDKFFRCAEAKLLKGRPPESESAVSKMDADVISEASCYAEAAASEWLDGSEQIGCSASTGHVVAEAPAASELQAAETLSASEIQADAVLGGSD